MQMEEKKGSQRHRHMHVESYFKKSLMFHVRVRRANNDKRTKAVSKVTLHAKEATTKHFSCNFTQNKNQG